MTFNGDDETAAPADPTAQGRERESEPNLEQRLSRLWKSDFQPSRSSGPQINELIDGYFIRRVLGSGAFGIVYLADDLERDRSVALKMPRPEVLLDSENRDRFVNEAHLASRLKHPGIIEVFETRLTGPTPYIAAAYCQGPDLAKWMNERTEPPPWKECVELVVQICDAVEHAHQNGVFHRDLKPANIMLSPTESTDSASPPGSFIPKVTDFGLAKLAAPTLTRTRSSLLIGTPMYMAPEQLAPAATKDAATIDVYALGVILFELLTGQFPVQGNSYFEVLDNIRATPATRLRTIRRDLPNQLDRICSICLRNNPQARYPTAADLSTELRRCLAGQNVAGRKTTLSSRLGYWFTRPKRITNAAWFLIANGTILTAWVLTVVGFSKFYEVVTWTEYWQQWKDALAIEFFGVLPTIWAGWQMLRGKHWPMWVGLAATVPNFPLLVFAIVDKPIMFQGIYLDLDPFFAFTVHIMLLICNAIQLFLLTSALVAARASAIVAKDSHGP